MAVAQRAVGVVATSAETEAVVPASPVKVSKLMAVTVAAMVDVHLLNALHKVAGVALSVVQGAVSAAATMLAIKVMVIMAAMVVVKTFNPATFATMQVAM